jgi:hypothetical protein
MCGGGRPQEHIDAEAQRERDRQARIAQERQRELDRLAREREATAAAQQAQLQALQQQQIEAEQQQNAQAAQLGAEQRQRLAGISARGTAVSESLQILARQPAKQAPTAAVDDKNTRQQGAKTTTASLRMGSGSYGAGSGANISV